jgi:DNA-binding NtrC family response regulator
MNTKPQILVIDDDAVVGRSFDRVLSRQGYDVSTALSGEEALDKIDTQDYDVVFTDIKMPGMDGLEVAQRIMDRCPWTPVVVITGYGNAENEAKARVLGTNGFVHKPLTPEIIENITLKALHDKESKAAARAMPAAANAPDVESSPRRGRFISIGRNVGMFLAAPIIGLAYVVAMPFVFFGTIAKISMEALHKRNGDASD